MSERISDHKRLMAHVMAEKTPAARHAMTLLQAHLERPDMPMSPALVMALDECRFEMRKCPCSKTKAGAIFVSRPATNFGIN